MNDKWCAFHDSPPVRCGSIGHCRLVDRASVTHTPERRIELLEWELRSAQSMLQAVEWCMLRDHTWSDWRHDHAPIADEMATVVRAIDQLIGKVE